jgi:predicted membrane-bound mannosyltransferase
MRDDRFWKSASIPAFVIVASVAAILFLWRLNSPYLWQDEAATAVMGQRMMRFGRPLAYDGVNLITGDHFAAEDSKTIDQRTSDPQSSIRFYARRGDFKADTTWQWQPWGQFVAAALSFKMLGPTTFAARLPFALASIVTVLVLYLFILTYFENAQLALLASIFLLANGYWVLHGRQCRYYALSSLFLMLTLAAYACWQFRKPWGAVAFVAAAWC